eukprot:TRINITY_DN90994_c0_g1_i1.p1 TRINITY_DN90994_c0_g1~~TRINITY_DN90994_c0_g1_i1.p1  ORF type:complete len:351 (-),score=41.32 TRINITY_DN90994_c0_g1_i1:111-1163(-)
MMGAPSAHRRTHRRLPVLTIGAMALALSQGAVMVCPQVRRRFVHMGLICMMNPSNAHAETMPEYYEQRTRNPPPRIPVATAVILLRTTQEVAVTWGAPWDKPGSFQTRFNNMRSNGMTYFRTRYVNYDLSELFDETMAATVDPRTNRLYFAFLNKIHFQVLEEGLKKKNDRDTFGRLLGERLYRKILKGDVVGPRVQTDGDFDPSSPVNMSSPFSGRWPALQPPLPKGNSAEDLALGIRQILTYLQSQGYCKSFSMTALTQSTAGKLEFRHLVEEPINIEVTSETVRRGSGFSPQFDQRILQTFFLNRGFESQFSETLADEKSASSRGVLTSWTLTPDDDLYESRKFAES